MNYKLLKIEGRSGCKFEFITSEKVALRKYSGSINYNNRLSAQANKQNCFKGLSSDADYSVKAPGVINIDYGSETDLSSFDMEYVYGQKFSEHLLNIGVDQLSTLAHTIINYLRVSKSKAKVQELSQSIFKNKINEISSKLDNNHLIDQYLYKNILDDLLNNIPLGRFPIGDCHGDLTFSNMIFTNNSIFFIDFLDSFINSYLIDIVKLRQDTFFYWSLTIDYNLNNIHRYRIEQSLHYIDCLIEVAFEDDAFYLDWYRYLQILNLLRILPYLNAGNEIKFIENSIRKIL